VKLEVRFEGGRARKQAGAPPPFGPGYSPDIVAKTETLEIHGSGVNDPGANYCEFRAFDASGNLVGTKKVGGY